MDVNKIKLWWFQKIDLVKTALWNTFAPNYYKLLEKRYVEMRDALDARDEEYEADLNELADENSKLVEELEKVKAERDKYESDYSHIRDRIQEMVAHLAE